MVPAHELTVQCRGVSTEIVEQGSGRPVVFLHSGEGLAHCGPLLDGLARSGRVLAPSHPGFGHTALPPDFRHVDDLAYFHLDLLDQLGLEDVVLVGASFGGWIAQEMAIRSTARIGHLVLIDALGVRHSTDETAVEIADLFALHPDEVARRSWVEPQRWQRSAAQMSDDELLVAARNRESLSLFAWMPYMVNPRLRRWLHRIDVPALVLWGEADQIANVDYGRACAAAIPGAAFQLIAGAAHYPSVEQPAAVASEIVRFAGLPACVPAPGAASAGASASAAL